MFTWLIITLCCNFPEQSLGVLRVRAVSLWLVQTAQTTKNITALGPAPGFPFPTPPPTSPNALRLSEMYSGWFFFCCIYPTVLSKSMLPFVSYIGNEEILAMPLKPQIRIDVKTLLYHILNARFFYFFLSATTCVCSRAKHHQALISLLYRRIPAWPRWAGTSGDQIASLNDW